MKHTHKAILHIHKLFKLVHLCLSFKLSGVSVGQPQANFKFYGLLKIILIT